MSNPNHFRSFAVPRQNNTALCFPSLDDAAEIATENQRELPAELDRANNVCSPIRLDELRTRVQSRLVSLAFQWTIESLPLGQLEGGAVEEELRQMAERWIAADSVIDRPLIFLSGHQPEIFHSGVWFKNSVLSKIALCHHGLAINLLIDHDLAKHHSIKVPAIDAQVGLSLKSITFAEIERALPWEMIDHQRANIDKHFPEAVELASHGLLTEKPLLGEYWRDMLASLNVGNRLGESLAIARHQSELRAGWRTLELPLSQLCDTWEFGSFVAEILARHREVTAAYNGARGVYRRHHHIRNAVHPVPPLNVEFADDIEWIETPFWIFSDNYPDRMPLWLARIGERWCLTDRNNIRYQLQDLIDCRMQSSDWEAIKLGGIKIRPRALMTTTFLRLFAADLFLHGIGGGKYDQVTDLIIKQLWGIEPRPFLVATCSLYLPMKVGLEEELVGVATQKRKLRKMRFSPERFLTNEQNTRPDLATLVEEKGKLLAAIPPRGEKRMWHERMQQINAELFSQIQPALDNQFIEYERALAAERLQKILNSREYAFVLFDRDSVFKRLAELTPITCPDAYEASMAGQL